MNTQDINFYISQRKVFENYFEKPIGDLREGIYNTLLSNDDILKHSIYLVDSDILPSCVTLIPTPVFKTTFKQSAFQDHFDNIFGEDHTSSQGALEEWELIAKEDFELHIELLNIQFNKKQQNGGVLNELIKKQNEDLLLQIKQMEEEKKLYLKSIEELKNKRDPIINQIFKEALPSQKVQDVGPVIEMEAPPMLPGDKVVPPPPMGGVPPPPPPPMGVPLPPLGKIAPPAVQKFRNINCKKTDKNGTIYQKIFTSVKFNEDCILDQLKIKKEKVKKDVQADMIIDFSKKQAFFDGSKTQKLAIVMKHLPKEPKSLLQAMESLDFQYNESLKTLVENWPKEKCKSLEDLLLVSKKNPQAQWQEIENYFLVLGTQSHILDKIQLWVYMSDFFVKFENVQGEIAKIMMAFQELENSQNFQQILGCINQLANKITGSESAYEFSILERVEIIKGQNGKSILEMIIEQLKINLKPEFKNTYEAKKCQIEKFFAMRSEFEKQLKIYQKLSSQEFLKTNFGTKLMHFFIESQSEIQKLESQHQDFKRKYQEMCDLYVVPKNDEKRQKLDKFLSIFTNFFDKVDFIYRKYI